MAVFCSECLHYEGGPSKNGRFDEDLPASDDCNAPDNQETFTDYYGANRTRAIQLPGKVNEQNDCAWFVLRSSYAPPPE